ncbi:hypothetical protein PV325_000656 [Microctonus aethiopoides]|nr:hypothetical protein PV325_000656 [Microctonus aethiopoides]KAK0093356.1 hypothetical protein PV326_013741 [Microctonus aethiopoides]
MSRNDESHVFLRDDDNKCRRRQEKYGEMGNDMAEMELRSGEFYRSSCIKKIQINSNCSIRPEFCMSFEAGLQHRCGNSISSSPVIRVTGSNDYLDGCTVCRVAGCIDIGEYEFPRRPIFTHPISCPIVSLKSLTNGSDMWATVHSS